MANSMHQALQAFLEHRELKAGNVSSNGTSLLSYGWWEMARHTPDSTQRPSTIPVYQVPADQAQALAVHTIYCPNTNEPSSYESSPGAELIMWTLRVTDTYIDNWQTNQDKDSHGNHDCSCPLAQALEQLLESKDTPVIKVTNANPETGEIVYIVQGGHWYSVRPTPTTIRAATQFIDHVDHLELGQPYPRKHVFHYSNPEPYHL